MAGFLIGAAAVGYAGYACYAPRSQLYGWTYLGAGPGSRQLALTYDDGPNDPHTLRLLEVLARHEVKATFFLIGRFAAAKPEIAREVARAGHVIGNHTFNHPNLIFCSAAKVRSELEQCRKILTDTVVGVGPGLERPQLLVALDQERELGLEGCAALALVEGSQEGVVLGLDHALRVQALGDDVGQRRLAHPDGALDGDVTGKLEKVGHDRVPRA